MAKKEEIPFLSIVVPCYNEAANLKNGALKEMAVFLAKQPYSWEVLVSDDGSSDESLSLIADFVKAHPCFRLLKNPHQGKAPALLAGVLKARGKLTLMTDMDQSAPLSEVDKLLPWFEKGYTTVIGSRGLRRQGAPWFRQLMALGFRFVRGLFLLREINDTQCGFKACRTEVLQMVFPSLSFFDRRENPRGWRTSAFDVELLFLLKKWGYRLKEVEIDWRDRDLARGKKHNFLEESKNMAWEVIRIGLNNWRGRYEKKLKKN